MNRPDLSICIPTYNRAQQVQSLVTTVLSGADDRIEVCVLDNASTDDTLARLETFNDARLSVHANETNRGVIFNILNVLDKARGRFGVLLLDKDNLRPELIDGFRRCLLDHPRLGFGYSEYDSQKDGSIDIYRQGTEALHHVAYVGHHPTGYFFDLDLLRSIAFNTRFSDFSFVGHFPFDFIFAELALLADGGIYQRPLFFPESIEGAAKKKSVGTDASREDAFFSPRGRLNTSISFARHIETLNIHRREKDILLAQRFIRGILASTIGYKYVMSNADLCSHYHTQSRRVTAIENVRFGLHFYSKFVREVTRGAAGNHLRQAITFHWQVLRLLANRIMRKRLST